MASSASYFDNTIRLWDVETITYKQTLSGHSGEVLSVLYSPDGQTIASAGGYVDNTIRLWDANTGEHKHTFMGHKGYVYSIAFSPDGSTLVSGSGDETILLWDLTAFTNINGSVSISPSPVQSPDLGEQLTLSLSVSDAKAVTGYQATIHFDSTALRYISSENGDYLPQGAFAVPAVVTENTVTLAAISLAGESDGDGTLASLTFEVVSVTASTVWLSKVRLTDSTGESSYPRIQNGQITEPESLKADVNGDDIVNIQDLVLVASNFGETEENTSDVNGDGVVNIVDLVLVAAAFGDAPAAPTVQHYANKFLTPEVVQQWLTTAKQLAHTDAIAQRGIAVLEALLAALTPKETVLLPNYPNPFNPETWIPYQLAKRVDVTVLIYSADGKLVRTLKLGQQAAGVYESRSRAAYWDGKNEVGEAVASGVYFYTLTAGDFTATRKMLIRK